MQLHEFIFSESRKCRLLRHISFWLAWFSFSSFVQLIPTVPENISLSVFTSNLIFKAIARMPLEIIFCYYIVYVLVPRYVLQRKFKLAIIGLLLSGFFLYLLTYLFITPIFNLIGMRLLGWKPLTPFIRYFFSFYSNINFTGPIPACCFMLSIKYFKNWYIKHGESQSLLHENAQAELQLLRAQVHPHFLFNTLNNIYSYTLTGHPDAASLVDKLSGMIDYMCTEGYKPLVPLEKEIQLLNDYIELEKVRYGSRLQMKVDICGNMENKLIAPLLMIPFVENCFKHGASKLRGSQWIEMLINIKDNQLDFTLMNSKPDEEIISDNKKGRLTKGQGIGLINVKKRLQLLYTFNHNLKLESTNTTYSVYLKVQLTEKEMIAEDVLLNEPQTVSYA